jgi:DNA polymerase-3 subunit alpha
MPDIHNFIANNKVVHNCDFNSRTEIIKYIKEKYGNGFAQIGTFLRMKTKNAIKDAMWALYGKNRKDPMIEAICELIPDSPQGVDEYSFLYGFTNSEGEYTPGIIEQEPQIAEFFKQFSQVEEMVKRLIKLVRGWGRHPSAFIISTADLAREKIPLMKMLDKNSGEYINVSQVEAPMVEAHGLVKADILGVTTIQTISDAVELIKARRGVDLLEENEHGVARIYDLPEDPAVYKDFYNKKTDSSFQFNTNLIKMYIRDFAPSKKDDLALVTAICRPGALDAPLFDTTAAQFYFDVRSGKRQLEFVHPDLEPLLKETLGVFVYQETIMKFLVEFAGYTLEESDQIRAAIAKKKQNVILSSFDRIRQKAEERGWTKEQADTVCAQVLAFARYSFNRSHSCLAPYQKVMTPTGSKMISTIKDGDLIVSANDQDGAIICEVSKAWIVGEKEVFKITLDDDSTMYLTEDHQVATQFGWMSVREAFKEGFEILCVNELDVNVEPNLL